ncbi:MAG: AAA family ATPase [Sphingobacteriia bacterium]|nr:AAA family ATPase [Sphingobacteriia bacterium]
MIITVGGVKGGAGKSTIATNLAIIASQDPKKEVLLIDADDQESSYNFTALRNELLPEKGAGYSVAKLTGLNVRNEVLNLKKKFNTIIIDTGGRDTSSQRAAITVSDILLVPYVPKTFDVWTVDDVDKILNEMLPSNPTLRCCAFLNRADTKGQDNEAAIAAIKNSPHLLLLDSIVIHRKAFGNAVAQGKSVIELRPKDRKAISEIKELYTEVFENILIGEEA